MCGRFASSASTADLVAEFAVQETLGDDLDPSWNVAPTDPVRVIVDRRPRGSDRGSEPVTQLRTFRWGLVPSWAKDRKNAASLINARQETVTEKPAFKAAAGRRRCLVPAGGYYEWQKRPEGKAPFYLHSPDGGLLAFAGLYEIWRDPGVPDDDPGRWLWTCTVITRRASDALGQIHDRTPVIVPRQLRQAWLDCSSGRSDLARQLLEGIPDPHLEPRAVSTAVNSVRNNGPELIEATAG